ncbi:hypothetical protein FDECE_13245 [Fusarium decemcellulare]|nr:hypothetical protein FDECE_13245 [Fusarium decemcellulare]
MAPGQQEGQLSAESIVENVYEANTTTPGLQSQNPQVFQRTSALGQREDGFGPREVAGTVLQPGTATRIGEARGHQPLVHRPALTIGRQAESEKAARNAYQPNTIFRATKTGPQTRSSYLYPDLRHLQGLNVVPTDVHSEPDLKFRPRSTSGSRPIPLPSQTPSQAQARGQQAQGPLAAQAYHRLPKLRPQESAANQAQRHPISECQPQGLSMVPETTGP